MSENVDQNSGGGARLGLGAIGCIVGLGALLIFVVQNREQIRFDFLMVNFTWPLWLYTMVIALVGVLIWVGFGVVRRHRRRAARRA